MFKHLNFRKLISQLKLNTPKALIPNLLRAISQVISRYGKLSPHSLIGRMAPLSCYSIYTAIPLP